MEDGLNLVMRENVFDSPEEIFERLEREMVYLPQEQCQIRMKGKTFPVSRKMVAFGDPDLTYTFSGLTLPSQPWTPLLLEIKTLVESLMGIHVNYVLINRYENGQDCIGQHKDDESNLDENSPICSLSFGETRTMVFKRPGYADKRLELQPNSLLLMNPPTNTLWTHGIPKQKKRTGVRINLTFRLLKTSNKRKMDENEANNKKIKEDPSKNEAENVQWCDSTDMKYLGGEIFLSVNHFLGQTRVHIRRFVPGKDGELRATKDGVSLTPKVWKSLCREVTAIFNPRSHEKTIVIEKDLCVSKQVKEGVELYVFQRLFQRKNMILQFVPEHVVLRSSELGKLIDNRSLISERVKDGLVTYTLSYHMSQELDHHRLELKPVDNREAFLELLESLSQCLLDALTQKITELMNCAGCRESYSVSFMHDCLSMTRSEKWVEYYELALYSINMRDVAKSIVQKNLHIDFHYVLGQEEFFDALNVPQMLESLEKKYVERTENVEDILFSCNNLCIN